MKTYSDFIEESRTLMEKWIPPSSKSLRGGKESPLSASRKKGTNVDVVRNSVKRFAEPINRPDNSDYDFNKNKDGEVTVKSKKYPIEVSYKQSDKPNTFIQNTKKTSEIKNKIGAAKEMQKIKASVSNSARPGTTILSQPVGERRASLNSRTQGMGKTNSSGVQGGRSPRQKAKGARPMDPINYKGGVIDH